MRGRDRIRQRFAGAGQILDGGRVLGDAKYELVEYCEVHTSASGEEVEGLSSTRGTIETYLPARFVGQELTLCLRDARRIDFLIKSAGQGNVAEIQCYRGFY
ncbi:MAG TPA: hypothetical protein VK421_01255 [Pyrinomonadaceae bacterium]|nr:hypothetical protein [Pyrinomonadaceae bacterium]